MGKLKLSLITNKRSRKMTFVARKRGIMKKLQELTTLCGVQACAVISSPYQSVPEVWPSKEGVEEVTSKFKKMPMKEQSENKMDQKTYLQERIAKNQKKVTNQIHKNREVQIRQFMFDCIEGKMSTYHYDAMDLHDLGRYIQNYIDFITQRIEIFTENNADAAAVAAPSGFYDHIQYQNMNQNKPELVQHQPPTDLYDHIQHEIYDKNLNQDMNLDSNHNLNLNLSLNSNLYPNH